MTFHSNTCKMYIRLAREGSMCMDEVTTINELRCSAQREEEEQCGSTADAISGVSVQPETGDRSAQTSTGPVGAMRCCVARAEVSCKGTVAETSKLMQCECELYDSECEKHKAMMCTHSTIASAGDVDSKAVSSILRHCTARTSPSSPARR
ncbi:hypothetical protein BJV74DRAFT_502500 [Russula compacta]|nr:hypothetical protein BJV74DRAFT_502500 [Russula compacta]